MRSLIASLLLFLALMPAAAQARYEVAFYSHELGNDFPHAFFTVKGHPDAGGPEVNTNYGFTARSITPAILFGPVAGTVDTVKPGYRDHSKRQFTLTVSDATYARLMATVAQWRDAGPRSYDLGSHNCVHFIGAAAAAAGLKADFPKQLMKRPRSYLQHVRELNPQLAVQP